jgi:hypothetical protein
VEHYCGISVKQSMKAIIIVLFTFSLGFLARAVDSIDEPWFHHVDGTSVKEESIDLNTNATERLNIRYSPLADRGVELERTTNNVVAWRTHVRPLGVIHSKYHHDVSVRIESDKILVTSIGAQRIFEVRALKTGALITRKVDDVRTERNAFALNVGIEEALAIAKTYVKNQHLDISDSYVDSVRLERVPTAKKGKFWQVTYLPKRYAEGLPIAGGQLYVSVYLDRTVEIGYGE